MKKIQIICLLALGLGLGSCKKYLDVNRNPNAPEFVSGELYLAAMQTSFAAGIQFDSRFLATYNQNWNYFAVPSTANRHYWDWMGYNSGSDAAGELWRNVYWRGGYNMIDMNNDARKNEKWDMLGIGTAMQAWGWQMLTDYHGEIIVTEAFRTDQNIFNYDKQEVVYAEVVKLAKEAVGYLSKSDGAVGSPLLQRYDLIYKGDRLKWSKFAYAILAINAHHLIKKAGYDPNLVIKYVDSSFTSNADDALVAFNGASTLDANFYGPLRQNLHVYGPGIFSANLLNGTVLGGGVDPRAKIMLHPSADGVYRGLVPGLGQSNNVATNLQRVFNMWGSALGTAAPAAPYTAGNPDPKTANKYLFTDKSGFPLITYSMLQFIKAEAAFKKGDMAMALDAYTKGINAHFDFVNTNKNNANILNITAAERAAYLANPNVMPATAAALTLQQIMVQKYIALWGYGFIETWTDLRKYNYDPAVFPGFALPATLFTDNLGKTVQRVRPRYNSEYVWNIEALKAIGGFEIDFHTKKIWIME
jgi:hypothetical protein